MKKPPPYNPKARCPKCGHGRVASRHEGRIEDDPCWYARKNNPPNKWPEHEYIHRTCERCHYNWPEAVLPSRRRADALADSRP